MVQTQGIVTKAVDWLEDSLDSLDGDVLLTSPFLTTDVCARIAGAVRDSQFSAVVVTKLDPAAVADGYLTVHGLRTLVDAGVEVRHVDRLHAKCFIVGSRAMLGSANLTGAGIGSSAKSNRELGVTLDEAQREQVLEDINSWPALPVSFEDLDELIREAEALTIHEQEAEATFVKDVVPQLVESLLLDARDPDRELWLKLEYGEPALDGWREESYFASPKKGKPGFMPGELVFICAKETRDCYAVVEVDGDPEYQPEDYARDVQDRGDDSLERWPWVTRTRPRLVPGALLELKLGELGVSGQALQNGHVRLKLDQFTAGVRALGRLVTD